MSEEQEFQYNLECDDGACYEIPVVGVAVEQPIFISHVGMDTEDTE